MRMIEQLRWWAAECDRTNFGCQARKLLLEAAEALEKADPQWIPVTERLPEESDADDAMGVYAVHKRSLKRYWHFASVKDNPFDFTHWMPLPKPPEDGERSKA